MDKFDEFLKRETEKENENFILSESFNLKIEDTLRKLEHDEKEKLYKNKKLISMAACFILVFLVGIRYTILNNSTGINNNSSIEMVADTAQSRDMNEANVARYSLESSKEVFIGVEDIQGLTIKSLSGESKFKFVNKRDDIKRIIDCINNISKSEIICKDVAEWDFLIQTSGAVNHTIEVKGSLITIDNRCYESEEDVSKIIRDIYSDLNYEEKDIRYCNVN